MAKRFIPFNEGLKLLGVSRSEGYRQQKTNPEFPKIVKPLGKGTKPSALDLDEVESYQAGTPSKQTSVASSILVQSTTQRRRKRHWILRN